MEFPEVVAGDRDLQFPVELTVTTDLLVGIAEDDGEGEAGEEPEEPEFGEFPPFRASGSGVDIPRFFLTSFWATRTRSIQFGGEFVDAEEEVGGGEDVTVEPSRRLKKERCKVFFV